MAKDKSLKRQQAKAGLPARVRNHLDGVMRELRLVTWPNREQVRATTMVVLVTVFAFAVYFGIVDYLLAWGQRVLYESFT